MSKTVVSSPLPKSIWPKAIISVFILLAVMNAVILKLALSTSVSRMDSTPYESGLAYQKIIDGKNLVTQDNLKAKLYLETNQLKLTVENVDINTVWKIKLDLIRPDNSDLDKNFLLESSGREFVFKTDNLSSDLWPSGLWMVRLELSSKEKFYYFEFNEIF
jgi:hypothetical protein